MYRIGKAEIEELTRVIESKQLFRQPDGEGHLGEVDAFEKEWAENVGVKYCLMNSGGGTGALICALVGLGIGPGDEVIVPAYTFMATAVAVLAAGAIPVIAEIDDTMAIDPEDVERLIGPNTKAVIPVHIQGMCADMAKICDIARKHGIKVIEDACQADGGSFHGKRLGSWGEVGCFSFNQYKIITCGEGGAMVTDDPIIYERAQMYHDSGLCFRPVAKGIKTPIFTGLQMRASELMGAVMRMQLKTMPGILADLRRIRNRMMAELEGKPGIRFARSNDNEGDSGVTAVFQFDSEEKARAFATAPGIKVACLPIDSEKHVYCNWEPVLEHRAGGHPSLNPFNLPQNQSLRMNYNKDMCPKTLDILSRTVYVYSLLDSSDAEVTELIQACEKAARAL
jgi:dTDP-4-amino-4,6-dideoxygalactose transaminase